MSCMLIAGRGIARGKAVVLFEYRFGKSCRKIFGHDVSVLTKHTQVGSKTIAASLVGALDFYIWKLVTDFLLNRADATAAEIV
jgi:hypothetical protein